MAKLKPIGSVQRGVLEWMLEHHGWHAGCGWCWSNYSTQMRVIKALIKRGFVVADQRLRNTHYDITESGRQEVLAHSTYYKHTYGGKA